MSEKTIVDAARRALDRRGAYGFKTTGVAIAGIPDYAGCYRGHYIAIEFKQPGRKPPPRQQRHLDLVHQAGGHAIVATNTNDVTALLDRIDERINQEASP